MRRLLDRLDGVGVAIAAASVLLITVLLAGNALLRSLSDLQLEVAVDATTAWLMPMMVFFVIAHLYKTRQHITFDLVTGLFPLRVLRWLSLATHLIVLGISVPLTHGAAVVAIESFVHGYFAPGVTRIPLFPGRASVAIGGALLCLMLVSEIFNQVRSLRGSQEEGEQDRDWSHSVA